MPGSLFRRAAGVARGLHGTGQHGTGQHGTGLHGTGQHGTGQHGTGQHGTGQHGTGQHGTGQHGTGQHGTGQAREQLALATRLRPLLAAPIPGPRYAAGNDGYGAGDAAVCRAMLAYLHPARMVAVGSAYPTALALDAADANHDLSGLEITCVEPHPERMLGFLKVTDYERITLLRRPVQEAVLAASGRLGPGDVLCTDSTYHVLRAGSDIAWLFGHVLPTLAPGVVVALHDVFWPLACDERFLERDDRASAYPARAFLLGGSCWRVLFFSSWLWRCHPELVPRQLAPEEPGSIWISKLG